MKEAKSNNTWKILVMSKTVIVNYKFTCKKYCTKQNHKKLIT